MLTRLTRACTHKSSILGCGLLKVRFAPDSDRIADIAEGPSCAMSGSELRPGPGGPIRSAKALIRRHLYKARHGAIVSAVTSHPASALPGSICPRSSPTSASMSRVSFSFMATTRDAVCRPWRDSPSRVDRPGDRTARRKKEYLTAHHVPCLRSRSAVHCWAMIGRTTPTSAHNASDQIR